MEATLGLITLQLFLSAVNGVLTTRGVTAVTTLGRAIGTIEMLRPEDAYSHQNNRFFYAFRGIPYARPPVESLRWQVSIRIFASF